MIGEFLDRVRAWAEREPGLKAVALVGSHARGEARPDSDVDLVLLSTHARNLLDDRTWVESFGVSTRLELEDWGRVTSVRVWYASGLEVEFGVTTPDWATAPDDGTRRVVGAGCRAIWDPGRIFATLASRAAPPNGPALSCERS